MNSVIKPSVRGEADRMAGAQDALRQKLPRLSGACQRLSNLFYGPRAVSELKAGERSLSWQWRHREPNDAAELVRLTAPQGDVWVAVERDHGFAADLALDWRSLEHDARLLAWSLSYEPVVQHLRALLGIAIEPVAIVPAYEVALGPPHCSLSFVVTEADSQPLLSGTVSFHPELLGPDISVAGMASKQSARISPVPVPFRVVVTTIDVPDVELRALAPDDIIALGTPDKIRAGARMSFESKNHEMRIAVRLGAVAARVEAIEVGQRPQTPSYQGSNQRLSMPSPEEPSVSAQVDGLPVTLSFEAGEISLTVAELKALAPGAMLSFGRKLADSPITVRANGRVLGIGELVLIDDFLGVRLIELRDHGSQ